MASKKQKAPCEEEKKIPVFTVLKSNAVLKNIFVLDNPSSISDPRSTTAVNSNDTTDQEIEEILTVGRHPDCNIMLTHPSISRFHLRIHLKPSSQKLSVIDLSSVHGTWISDKKIEPNVPVELNEGDTVRVGGSSRVYRLHWVPLTKAYDLENPFVSKSDVLMAELREEENVMLEEGKEEEACQDENSLLSGDNSVLFIKENIPSAPPMPENMNSSVLDEEVAALSVDQNPSRKDYKDGENLSLGSEPLAMESVNLIALVGTNLSENENPQVKKANQCSQSPVVTHVLSETEDPRSPIRRPDEKLFLPKKLDSSLSGEEDGSTSEALEQIENQSPLSLCSRLLASVSDNLSLPSEMAYQQYYDKENHTPKPLFSKESVNPSLSPEIEYQQFDKENQTPKPLFATESPSARENSETPRIRLEQNSSIWSRRGKPASVLQIQTARSMGKSIGVNIDFEVERQQQEDIGNKWILGTGLEGAEDENFTLDKENFIPNTVLSKSLKKKGKVEEIKHSMSYGSPSTNVTISPSHHPEEKFSFTNEDNQRQNELISYALFPGLGRDEDESFTPNKENFTPNTLLLKSLKRKSKLEEVKNCISYGSPSTKVEEIKHSMSDGSPSTKVTISPSHHPEEKFSFTDEDNQRQNELISNALFPGLGRDEDESFTPNKENFTPNTLLLKSMKRKSKLEEVKHCISYGSPSTKVSISPSIHQEQNKFAFSDNENMAQKVFCEWKSARSISSNRVRFEQDIQMKRREERVPFQPLLVNSSSKSKSKASPLNAATRSSNSVNRVLFKEESTNPSSNKTAEGGKRRWYMVVDTSCLLDKESRKSLQLLQGLKGTQLIIPRMVVRELDCLKRRGSLFRSKTEVSSALQWIEMCMVDTKWWIHVQNSVEEGRPIASTPPASPQTGRFSSGTISSLPFSAFGSLIDVASPNTDDHILECALFFRRILNDGQLVLLTNDIALKIKAMAEGVICETAKEFQETLVNPFSERFLWSESSPRGRTWSCLDDVVLKEKFYSCPLKKATQGEGLKGLKLILHNNILVKSDHSAKRNQHVLGFGATSVPKFSL